MNQYNLLIIDSLNFAYNRFDKDEHTSIKVSVNNRDIYPAFVRDMIESITYIQKKYCTENSHVFLLFDNPTSRDQIKKLFYPLSSTTSRKKVSDSYKSSRKKASSEFYNSVDILKYYYMVHEQMYHTVRITNLEADDLISPCIQYAQNNGLITDALLVSNDSDWCKYLTDTVHILQTTEGSIITPETFKRDRGFEPTEEAIILQKILEGDVADDVPAVVKDLIPPEDRQQILHSFDSIEQVYASIEDSPLLQQYCEILKEKEREIKSVYQMLATIPITEKQFRYNCVNGRNAIAQRQWIEGILYGSQKPEEITFSFNTIKAPRVEPKG